MCRVVNWLKSGPAGLKMHSRQEVHAEMVRAYGAERVEVWLGCRTQERGFVASTAFHGRRRGYYFGTGEGGTGYYLFPLRERLAAGRIYGL